MRPNISVYCRWITQEVVLVSLQSQSSNQLQGYVCDGICHNNGACLTHEDGPWQGYAMVGELMADVTGKKAFDPGQRVRVIHGHQDGLNES